MAPASGGASSKGGTSSSGGSGNATSSSGGSGNAANGGSVSSGSPPGFGTPTYEGMGSSADRYAKANVRRNGVDYEFMANGWGPKFQSQTVSWHGTSFSVDMMQGDQGPNYEPSTYPTMFCGLYSTESSIGCGLPKAISSIRSLYTGWRWNANGNSGQYNAAWDIWLSTSDQISGHSSFLMVWLRDPPGQQPAGSVKADNVQVPNVPGTWRLWYGSVGGKPYVAYARAEGQDQSELEFDVMNFWRDATSRSSAGISLPGSYILSVAVGFEIWKGPVTSLETEDFYIDVK